MVNTDGNPISLVLNLLARHSIYAINDPTASSTFRRCTIARLINARNYAIALPTLGRCYANYDHDAVQNPYYSKSLLNTDDGTPALIR